MASIFVNLVPWYLALQLCAFAAMPLAMRFFGRLPESGYAFTKVLGVFLVGVILWLGTSYALLRNEFGGAMFALGIVTVVSYAFGGLQHVRAEWRSRRVSGYGFVWYVLSVEVLFLAGFAVWAWVRAHDPAANHTEQPMDLMFMNSIWISPEFPPQDAWLAGYPISYYYLGYWLLNTLGHLSSTPPSLAYNVGQASWYGLLLTASYGLGFNLYSLASRGVAAESEGTMRRRFAGAGPAAAGVLTALFVGVIGNLQVVLEWLYARGADVAGIAEWVDVNGFPENAQRSGKWYIGYDWWWWRSSRVLSDQDLLGNHIEVIDEFPMFSYILGDNHPHVLSMPVVIVVIAMALCIYLRAGEAGGTAYGANRVARAWNRLRSAVPLGLIGIALVIVVSGGLVFLNTWDYPPYWLLLTASLYIGTSRALPGPNARTLIQNLLPAALFGALLAMGTLGMYLPYFLTAQSQAGGFVPNLFNPSRIQQVALMFGVFVPAVAGLLFWGWRMSRPTIRAVVVAVALVLGLPAVFLAASALIATNSARGQALLSGVVLPPGASSHAPYIAERWLSRGLTFVVFGLALALGFVAIWMMVRRAERTSIADAGLFVLMAACLGIALIYAPEFVFLRDNFGTRMNTVFKFYYQAWLLLAIASAYVATGALFLHRGHMPAVTRVLGVITLIAAMGGMLFPVAGVYSKTTGFASEEPTLDATRYVSFENAAEAAAIRWVIANTDPDDVVLEGKGASYRAAYNRISTMTGRPTLLGWDGHESQWRGKAYGTMASGRAELLEKVYRTARADEIPVLLAEWGIDYVYVGPTERLQYDMTPRSEERIAEAMDLVFDGDGARIYRRR